MRIDPASHRVVGVRFVSSPNYDERPANTLLSLIVIQLFTNQLDPNEHPYFKKIAENKVSAHLLIRRNGELLQFVPFNKRAWHAGESNYNGKSRANDFSIGIELEGADEVPYEPEQYSVLASLVDALRMAYPSLNKQDIAGHSDIAPGRKSDPGLAFEWEKFRDLFGLRCFLAFKWEKFRDLLA